MTEIQSTRTNKEIFIGAFADFAAGRTDALYSILHENFIEHAPGNPSGRDAFMEFIKRGRVSQARFELMRVIADEQYVVAHYRMIDELGSSVLAVVDIWKFDAGLITEHWDVKQPVPDDEEIPNGMF